MLSNSNPQLATLCRMAVQVETYNTKIVRNVALSSLKYTAQIYGYSFEHFEATGIWKTYTELEVQGKVEMQVNEMQVQLETQVVETQKKPNTCKQDGKLNETQGNDKHCEACKRQFRMKRKTQRFCSDKCRNDFNNARR